MDDSVVFQKIDDAENKNSDTEYVMENERNIQDAFVTGLPDWDLEPPFDTIKRSVNK